MEMFDAMEGLPHNPVVVDNFVKAYSYINRPTYKKIVASISGGADSDIVLDICTRCDKDLKIDYVWFDTGLEYQATKEHLEMLEEWYGISIKKIRAKVPVPVSCKKYGQPFLSKKTSDMIERLQNNDFKWEDEPFEVLYEKYPKCKSALRWWCNAWGNDSQFNIRHNKWLKEFMVANPPSFKISSKCCKYAKKDLIHNVIKENNYDLNIYGVRKAEGGARATAYKSCFDTNIGECDEYRPIFWYSDSDKADYEEACGISHSKCYTEYGLKRTGCCGCPFGRKFEEELAIVEKHEPKLFKAINNIFKDSYDYTRRYKEFANKMERQKKNGIHQMSLFDGEEV